MLLECQVEQGVLYAGECLVAKIKIMPVLKSETIKLIAVQFSGKASVDRKFISQEAINPIRSMTCNGNYSSSAVGGGVLVPPTPNLVNNDGNRISNNDIFRLYRLFRFG